MFRILPIAEVFILPFLPVELWSTILRLLDLKSLLAAARTDRTWMAVCQGDPVLKKRLRRAVHEEEQEMQKFMLDPGLSTRVVRQVPASKSYAANLRKIVTSCPKPIRQDFVQESNKSVPTKRKAPKRKLK
ncbi:hypothetical protein NQ315_005489 [Exocentrus adspersus]|uniref:F-box domain-containing protein n=1 Tax=Exocentrus adspersus TaxID=1586481 RepID=A0AAV8VTR8_9CUCU|nr:hypothetical protein NQ315_005489 [Exocentrus adspersus]